MPIDASSLTQPMDAVERRRYEARDAAGEFGHSGVSPLLFVALPIAAFFLLGFVGMAFQFAHVVGSIPGPNKGPFVRAMPFVPITLVVAVLALAGWVVSRRLRVLRRWPRLARLADRNGMRFVRAGAQPDYPALLFQQHDRGAVTEHLFASEGLLASVGGYEWDVESNDNSRTVRRWLAAFRLPRPVPQLVLTSRGGSSLPVTFTGDQRVEMGHPFDQYYVAWAPSGYGRDLFQLLPPDLQEQLVRLPGQVDLEWIDGWMFACSRAPLDPTDPRTWQLVNALEGVAARSAQVADRYVDDRTPQVPASTGVTATAAATRPGRWDTPASMARPPAPNRLRTRSSTGAIVLGVAAGLGVVAAFVVMALSFHAMGR